MRLCSWTLAGPGTAPIIGDALRSVVPIVDSSLVVWTGEGFGNDIFEAVVSTGVDFEIAQWRWCDDFGAARQAALDAARSHLFGDGWQLGLDDWSVMVDTDERVICPDPAALRVYLEALPADVMIVCVHTAEGTYSRERFFRSTIKARWYLRTHETIDDIDGARRVVAPRWLITWTELPKNEATIRAKCARDHAMLLCDLADHPGNGRVLFYLGNTLEHLGRYEEALVYYRQVSLLGFGEGPAWACFCAARNHLRTEPKKIEEAYSACVAAVYREPRLAEPYWLAAAICLDMGRPELALAMAQNAKVHGAGSESAEGVGGFREPFALDRGPDELIAQARAALAARRGIGAVADDVETSGERLVVEMARRRCGDRPAVVFDVGANRGQWARMAWSILEEPPPILHCFEPSAGACEELMRVGFGRHEPTTFVHQFALSSAEDTVLLYADANGSGLASLYRRAAHRGLGAVSVETRRLDDVCVRINVERIDLLKIDVEGHEIEVLRGAIAMLSAGKIDAIQFEFGGACIDSRVFLRDFFDLLVPHGFAIHRVTPTGIEGPIVYSEREEIFVSSNFLALRTAAWGGGRKDHEAVASLDGDGDEARSVFEATAGLRSAAILAILGSSQAVRAIVFSRDRPMQLDACLRSLRTHCRDIDKLDVCVIVRWTSKEFEQAYGEVDAANPWANFVCEVDFETDTRSLLAGTDCEHVLFVVDDTVFVRPFAVAEMVADLEADPGTIGYSLRLGANTTWNYPANRAQAVPDFWTRGIYGSYRGFDWATADGDFGYPLEVSSSLYRAADVRAWLAGRAFRNPNDIEAGLDDEAHGMKAGRVGMSPRLLCAPLSLAFSVPCNRVQSTHANRAGDDADLSADALLRRWQDGWRIDVAVLAGHTPRACHEEVAYAFEARPDFQIIGPDGLPENFYHLRRTCCPSLDGREHRGVCAKAASRSHGALPLIAPRPISITVTSTGFRADAYAYRCIQSVYEQTLDVRHVYVAADRATFLVADLHLPEGDAIDGIGLGLLANLLPIWRSLPPDEVIVWLDGDDWLAQDHALERVAAAHRAGALVTYGSFMYADGRPCIAGPCGDDPRSEPWRSSHLKSFRAGLVQRIRESDWRWGDGSWLDLSIDQAVMLPCLEMAGRDRSVYIPEILCVYNYAHSFGANADAAGLAREAEALRMVRGRPRYERIGGL